MLVAVGAILYPTIANYISQAFTEYEIEEYSNQVSAMSDDEKKSLIDEAKVYNQKLVGLKNSGDKSAIDKATSNYNDILSINKKGQMGVIVIPSIDVNLPVYHGTEEKTLSYGAGHLRDTSFPVGGESTHAVISAHTAFPNRVFFDKIPELKKGEKFYLEVLGTKMAYKIVDINIVSPKDTSKLEIQEGKDLVSLITCYPYAVNTHRYIVTGERVFEDEKTIDNAINNVSNNNVIIWAIFSMILLIILIVIILKKKIGN